jgi:hypothetical protein
MSESEVRIGGTYLVRIGRILAPVRIDCEARYGYGWWGVNLITHKEVRVRSVRRIRAELKPEKPDLILRLSDDGCWRWFGYETNADTGVVGYSARDAWEQASFAWHAWGFTPVGPFAAVLKQKE